MNEESFLLLGLALYTAQKFEYGLYGIASHLSHLPVAKKDRRFTNLTPEIFLSSDPEHKACRKATLGQICELFGDSLLISGEELESFVASRNLIVHDFWREVNPLKDSIGIQNPDEYLREFIEKGLQLTKVLHGLLSHMIEAAAKSQGRLDEIALTECDIENRKAFEAVASKWLTPQ
ncbi:MAG: hypothetical protein ABFC42_07930 [Sulfuricella sp.]